jgi:hypothetical protein
LLELELQGVMHLSLMMLFYKREREREGEKQIYIERDREIVMIPRNDIISSDL